MMSTKGGCSWSGSPNIDVLSYDQCHSFSREISSCGVSFACTSNSNTWNQLATIIGATHKLMNPSIIYFHCCVPCFFFVGSVCIYSMYVYSIKLVIPVTVSCICTGMNTICCLLWWPSTMCLSSVFVLLKPKSMCDVCDVMANTAKANDSKWWQTQAMVYYCDRIPCLASCIRAGVFWRVFPLGQWESRRGGLRLFSDLKPDISMRWHLFHCRSVFVISLYFGSRFSCLGPSGLRTHCNLENWGRFQKAHWRLGFANECKIWYLTSCFFIPKVFLAAAGSMIFLPEKPLEGLPSEAFLA